jgi:hypothetical protein
MHEATSDFSTEVRVTFKSRIKRMQHVMKLAKYLFLKLSVIFNSWCL